MSRFLHMSLLAVLALPMAAQTPGLSVAAGPLLGFDSLRKATHGNGGFLGGADYAGRVPGAEMPARAGVTLGLFPGQEWNGLKTSLSLAQVHGDVLVPLEGLHGYGIFGVSLNVWSMAKSGTEATDAPDDIDHHFPVRDAKGLKLGLRMGFGYTLSRTLALEATFQQTELAGKDLNDPLVRQGGVNPGWLDLTLRYAF